MPGNSKSASSQQDRGLTEVVFCELWDELLPNGFKTYTHGFFRESRRPEDRDTQDNQYTLLNKIRRLADSSFLPAQIDIKNQLGYPLSCQIKKVEVNKVSIEFQNKASQHLPEGFMYLMNASFHCRDVSKGEMLPVKKLIIRLDDCFSIKAAFLPPDNPEQNTTLTPEQEHPNTSDSPSLNGPRQ